MPGELLAPAQKTAIAEMRHVAATTTLGFALALAAAAVAARRGPRAGAAFYSLTAAGAGLWYARYAPGHGQFLAGTGVSAGVLAALDWAVGLLERRVGASGVLIAPYSAPRGVLFPNPQDLAARALAACSAAVSAPRPPGERPPAPCAALGL